MGGLSCFGLGLFLAAFPLFYFGIPRLQQSSPPFCWRSLDSSLASQDNGVTRLLMVKIGGVTSLKGVKDKRLIVQTIGVMM